MKVKELLSSPERWTQGFIARDLDGDGCGPTAAEAVCWCLTGALVKCYGRTRAFEMAGMFYPVIPANGGSHADDIVFWNDASERTFEDVRQLVTELDI